MKSVGAVEEAGDPFFAAVPVSAALAAEDRIP